MPKEVVADRPSIREVVAEALGNLGDRTRNQVIEYFAQNEATKQANALVAGLEKLNALEKERIRIKPQPSGFNGAGEPVGDPVFSKEQVEQIKKLGEQIEKLSKAINKADDNGDFGDLYNLTKGGKGESQG